MSRRQLVPALHTDDQSPPNTTATPTHAQDPPTAGSADMASQPLLAAASGRPLSASVVSSSGVGVRPGSSLSGGGGGDEPAVAGGGHVVNRMVVDDDEGQALLAAEDGGADGDGEDDDKRTAPLPPGMVPVVTDADATKQDPNLVQEVSVSIADEDEEEEEEEEDENQPLMQVEEEAEEVEESQGGDVSSPEPAAEAEDEAEPTPEPPAEEEDGEDDNNDDGNSDDDDNDDNNKEDNNDEDDEDDDDDDERKQDETSSDEEEEEPPKFVIQTTTSDGLTVPTTVEETNPVLAAPVDTEDEELAKRLDATPTGDDELDKLLSLGDILLSETPLREAHRARAELATLARNIANEELDPFESQFQDEVREEVLVVGSVPVDELERRERELEDERIRTLQAEADRHTALMAKITKRERAAKREVARTMKSERDEIRQRERRLGQQHQNYVSDQQSEFRKAEDLLKKTLAQKKARINDYFGDLHRADDVYGAVRARKYRIEWERAPRVVRIRVDLLRAVKNKLPRGRYAVMVTLFDRLGGHALRWSKLEGVYWTGSTPFPRRHRGKFFDLEMSFAQKRNRMFLACPSQKDARPSHCFVFELFLLRGHSTKVDKVVAWGAFPMAAQDFDTIQGKFKVPLMRGPMDTTVDKFQTLEERMSTNLDSWLCNLYFDIRHLPRSYSGEREYDVEMKFTRDRLQLQAMTDFDGAQSDSDHSIDGEHMGAQRHAMDSDSDDSLMESEDEGAALLKGSGGYSDGEDDEAYGITRRKAGPSSKKRGSIELHHISDSESDVADEEEARTDGSAPTATEVGADLHPEARQQVGLGNEPGDADDGIGHPSSATGGGLFGPGASGYQKVSEAPRRQDRRASSLGAESGGQYNSRVRAFDLPPSKPTVAPYGVGKGASLGDAALFAERSEWDPLHESIEEPARADPLARAKELQRYKFSIIDVDRDVPADVTSEKMRYMFSEMVSDMGLASLNSLEFWATMVILLLVFWFRLYVHCLGQYLFLRAMRVPVFEYESHVITCDLSYSNDNLQTVSVFGVVAMGPVANLFLFVVFLIISTFWQGIVKTFSDTASRFMLLYGVVTALDPILTVIVDVSASNWSGDAFKLYNYFEETEGNGLPGIFVTAILSAGLVIFGVFVLYFYILRLHMNGRMLDVYLRLHGDESSFFVPDDMEISVRTLRWVLTKAKRWRGFHGAKRAISVVSYKMRDHLDPNFEESTTHVALFTQDLYGDRELFRHFVVNPDGAIIEMFDSVELMGADNYRKLEKLLLATRPEQSKLALEAALQPPGASTSVMRAGGASSHRDLPGMDSDEDERKHDA